MTTPDFDGRTYNRARDGGRLKRQLLLVRDAMADHGWHTLHELSEALGEPEASISARFRDLRKPKFGGHIVDRRYLHDGLFAYRMQPDTGRVVAPRAEPLTNRYMTGGAEASQPPDPPRGWHGGSTASLSQPAEPAGPTCPTCKSPLSRLRSLILGYVNGYCPKCGKRMYVKRP